MFNVDWVDLHPPGRRISPGINVAILARVLGVWSGNACRIVYLTDETSAIETYRFAYGTLRDRAEKGDERFAVTWEHAGDSVYYEQFAFSRPNHLLTRDHLLDGPHGPEALRERRAPAMRHTAAVG